MSGVRIVPFPQIVPRQFYEWQHCQREEFVRYIKCFDAALMTLPCFSRRQFIGGTAGWLRAAALGMGRDDVDTKTVSIFHTTDLHGHIVPTSDYQGNGDLGGIARCATFIREGRRRNPDSLLLDIGDVYQGTAESLSNGGQLMIGLFNRLGYDAWALGNHDFDWGTQKLEENLALSKSPILTGNLDVGGKKIGSLEGNWKGVVPWIMKEVAGFRIALIGLTTPGLPYWLAPETLGGINVQAPGIALQKSVNEAKAAGANAIVVMGHMGHRFKDDFANPLQEMFSQVKGVDVLLAGHTHQNQPSWEIGGVLCSQASYYGIHCGKLDLTFDRASGKLVGRNAATTLMDKAYALDPGVMEVAQPELKAAEEQLSRKVATVSAPIPGKGRGSRLVSLFCEIFSEGLKRNNTPVEGVFHGTFGTGDLPPGDITVGDCWKLLPYENLLITAEVTAGELIEIVKEEAGERNSDRTLWPFDLKLGADGQPQMFLYQGNPVPADRRFRIGFNSYDSQSGGQRLMRLREIIANPASKRTMTPIDTRGALIEGFLNRGTIS